MKNKILVSLEDWGCDVSGAMARFLDDAELYVTCLETVIYDDAYERLGYALENDLRQDAFESAHTLKGVLANLGLTPMYELIVDIVEPLRSDSMQNLDLEYQKLLDANEYLKQILGK